MNVRQDCPKCGSRLSIDEEGYCNAGCGVEWRIFHLGDLIDGYLVTSVTPGKVCLTRIDPTGPDS